MIVSNFQLTKYWKLLTFCETEMKRKKVEKFTYLSYCRPTQSRPVTVGIAGCCSRSASNTDDSELTESHDMARFNSVSLWFNGVCGLLACSLVTLWIDWRLGVRLNVLAICFFCVEYCSRYVSETVLCKLLATANGFVVVAAVDCP